jgi:uncharacterized protein YndB with AHSA1/START domain
MTNTSTSPSLTINRTFKAPRERVFAAFTDAETMQRWMGPPGSIVTHASFDARVGGEYRITFSSPNYGEMTVKGTITAMQAPSHLAYTWRWEENNPGEEHDTLVTIDFIDHGAETEMHMVHEGFTDDESRDRHIHGWEGAFSKIDTVLAS